MVSFPDGHKNLIPNLSVEVMATLDGKFVSRINLATGEVVAGTRALVKGSVCNFI